MATLARGFALQLAVADIDALAALDPYAPHELAGALFGAAVPADHVLALLPVKIDR